MSTRLEEIREWLKNPNGNVHIVCLIRELLLEAEKVPKLLEALHSLVDFDGGSETQEKARAVLEGVEK